MRVVVVVKRAVVQAERMKVVHDPLPRRIAWVPAKKPDVNHLREESMRSDKVVMLGKRSKPDQNSTAAAGDNQQNGADAAHEHAPTTKVLFPALVINDLAKGWKESKRIGPGYVCMRVLAVQGKNVPTTFPFTLVLYAVSTTLATRAF